MTAKDLLVTASNKKRGISTKDLLTLAGNDGHLNEVFAPHRFVGDGVVLTKKGHLLCGLELRGIDPCSLTESHLELNSERIMKAMNVFPENVRVYQYLIKRFHESIKTEGTYQNQVVSETVKARNDAVSARKDGLYCIDLYWVILYEADSLLPGRKKGNTAKTITVARKTLKRNREALLTIARAFQSQTRESVNAQVLGNDAMFGFLRRLTNLDDDSAKSLPIAPDAGFDHLLMDRPLTVHEDGVRIGTDHLRVLNIRQIFSKKAPNLMRDIYELPCGVMICMEFKRMSIFDAQKVIDNARSYYESAHLLGSLMGLFKLIAAKGDTKKIAPDKTSKDSQVEVDHLAGKLSKGDTLGQMTLTVVLYHKDPLCVDHAVADAIKTAGQFGGSFFVETFNALNAYLAIIPGNIQAGKRKKLWVLQSSVADLALIYAPDRGDRVNKFLKSEYLFVAETNSHTPHFLNLHWNDICNVMISGVTGAGKSVVSNMILDHLQKLDPYLVILDMGESYKQTCQKHGGSYAALDISKDKKWFINPFSLEDTDENIEFLETFVKVLLSNARYEPTYKDDKSIHEAVIEIYSKREGARRLGNLKLPDHLKEALYIWTGDGPYARVFDNTEDTLTMAKFQVFELQKLEEYPKVLEPLFFYIFRRQQAVVQDPKLRQTFKLLWADEVWRFLANPTCRSRFVTGAKTFRKHNAGIGLVTQSAFDFKDAGLLQVIAESCPTKIFLANPSADFDAYATMFHLNAAEVANFKSLTFKKQVFMKKSEEPGVVLNVNLSPLELVLYGNSPLENHLRDEAIEKYGWAEGIRRLAATTA